MADRYRLLLHPELGKELQGLSKAAGEDPNGAEAQQFRALKDGLLAVRDGREAERDGKRMHSLKDQYGDISDCAEIKVPVVREFAPNGYEFGPSHRLTYREFDGTQEDPTPVREAIAFEPRRGGRPFQVTADRLNRAVGVSLSDLSTAQDSGQQQTASNERAPVRRQLPHELAAAAEAASDKLGATPARQLAAAEPDAVLAHRLAATSFSRPATEVVRSAPARGSAGSGVAHPGGQGTETPAAER